MLNKGVFICIASGQVFTFGHNYYGTCLHEDRQMNRTSPTEVDLSVFKLNDTVVDIAAGMN